MFYFGADAGGCEGMETFSVGTASYHTIKEGHVSLTTLRRHHTNISTARHKRNTRRRHQTQREVAKSPRVEHKHPTSEKNNTHQTTKRRITEELAFRTTTNHEQKNQHEATTKTQQKRKELTCRTRPPSACWRPGSRSGSGSSEQIGGTARGGAAGGPLEGQIRRHGAP